MYKKNKDVGLIKEVDNLGRIVIPKEYRTLFNLNKKVEIVATKDGLLIRNPEYKLVKIEKTIDKYKIL